MAEITGWAAWRGHTVIDVRLAESKSALLIRYDFTPLRGLKACEADLAAEGIVVLPTRLSTVPEAEGELWAPTVRGEFVLSMLAWSCCRESRDRALISTARYLWGNDRALGVTLTETESRELESFSYSRSLREDKRRRSTLVKLTARVEATFAREQVAIVPVRYERVLDEEAGS